MSIQSQRSALLLLAGLGCFVLLPATAISCGGDDNAATSTTSGSAGSGDDTGGTDTTSTTVTGGTGGGGGSAGRGGNGGRAGSSDAGKDSSRDAMSDDGKADARADGAKDGPPDAGAVCGNAMIDGKEQCDNGTANDTCETTADGGSHCNQCSPICTDNTACLACMARECPEFVDLCSGVEGVAADGPGQGKDRVLLCHQAYKCIMQSGCGIAPLGNETLSCYCGDKDAAACGQTGMANGPCRVEIQAAMETFDAAEVINRYTDLTVAGGAALQKTLCEVLACLDSCYYGRVVPGRPNDGGTDGSRD